MALTASYYCIVFAAIFVKNIGSTSESVTRTHVADALCVTWYLACRYIYAACSGVIGSMSLLFAGCTSKMLARLFHGTSKLCIPYHECVVCTNVGRIFAGHYSEYSHPLPYVIIGE